jgi:hypothetical protein
MIIDGKEYYSVQETEGCAGCAFSNAANNLCAKALRALDCGIDKIIWKEAEPTVTVNTLKILRQKGEEEPLDVKEWHPDSFTASEREHLEKYPHYYRDIRHLNVLDIYRVLGLFSTGDAALDHAAKKILAAGKRGAKDKEKDIKEAIDTLSRRLEMLEEDKKC